MVNRILLASVRGTCAGVDRALRTVNYALASYKKVYVIHEPVHNKLVTSDLRSRGLCFVDDVREIPEGAAVVLSAHGTELSVIGGAQRRGLVIIDATCPLVTRIHNEVKKYERDDRKIIIIGDSAHREVVGIIGQLRFPDRVSVVKDTQDVDSLPIHCDECVAYVIQTTFNIDHVRCVIDALKNKFSDIVGSGMRDICFATRNRQNAVKRMAELASVVIVIGSQNSSNSKNLKRIAEQHNSNVRAYLVDELSPLDLGDMLKDCSVVGMTAGASVTDGIFKSAVDVMSAAFPGAVVSEMSSDNDAEEITFPVPACLRP